MSTHTSRANDAALVERAVSGDEAAFAEIYDLYADSIYSFCRSRLRNEADAADAMQDTFVRAATKLSQLRNPEKLRSWLFAIARNQIIATGRASAQLVTGDDEMENVVDDRNRPEQDLLLAENSAELWDAIGALTERDQEVLELHVRHGLVGRELADAIGVAESHANVLLSRSRDRIATSMGTLLVARQGRDECEDLQRVLQHWDGKYTREVRDSVMSHVRGCDVCERTKSVALAQGMSFGVLPVVTVPDTLRADTVARMFAGSKSTLPGAATGTAKLLGPVGFADGPTPDSLDWQWAEDGFPTELALAETRRRGAYLSAAAAFVLVLALTGIAALLLTRSDDSLFASADQNLTTSSVQQIVATTEATEPAADQASPDEALDNAGTNPSLTNPPAPTNPAPTNAPTTTQPTTTVEPSTSPSTTTSSPSSSTTSSTTTSTTTTSTTTTTAAPAVEVPEVVEPVVPPTESVPETTDPPAPPSNVAPTILRATARPGSVEVDRGRCPGQPLTILVLATDSDGAVETVIAQWSNGVDEFTTNLVPSGAADTFSATVGPWVVLGEQAITVVAFDDLGASASSQVSISVTGCPPG